MTLDRRYLTSFDNPTKRVSILGLLVFGEQVPENIRLFAVT
jgi:hypothetical protein